VSWKHTQFYTLYSALFLSTVSVCLHHQSLNWAIAWIRCFNTSNPKLHKLGNVNRFTLQVACPYKCQSNGIIPPSVQRKWCLLLSSCSTCKKIRRIWILSFILDTVQRSLKCFAFVEWIHFLSNFFAKKFWMFCIRWVNIFFYEVLNIFLRSFKCFVQWIYNFLSKFPAKKS